VELQEEKRRSLFTGGASSSPRSGDHGARSGGWGNELLPTSDAGHGDGHGGSCNHHGSSKN